MGKKRIELKSDALNFYLLKNRQILKHVRTCLSS